MHSPFNFHHQATVVDFHAHPSLKKSLFRRNIKRRYPIIPAFLWPPTVRTSVPSLEQGGIDVICSAVYAPEKRLFDDMKYLKLLRYLPLPHIQHIWKQFIDPPYFTVVNRLLNEMEQQIANPGGNSQQRQLVLIRSVNELNQILQHGQKASIAVIHTVEGGHALESESGSANEILNNLQALFDRSVAVITLGHFYPNRLVMPVPSFPDMLLPFFSPTRLNKLWNELDLTKGLTPTGKMVVERMIELGILIDISHCTPVARREIFAIAEARATRPCVVASHVGSYELNPRPYNLEDWEVRWIADHGGVIGVIFMNYWLMPSPTLTGLHYIARTVEQFVRAAGGRTDHIAFGSDFDGFTDPPDDLKDESQFPRVTEYLLAEGREDGQRKYSDTDLEKILGQNALRVLREGWGKQT